LGQPECCYFNTFMPFYDRFWQKHHFKALCVEDLSGKKPENHENQ